MKFEENSLPLRINKSEKLTEHGDSAVERMNAEKKGGQEEEIVLKTLRKEEFATPEEMKEDRQFYESLKNSPMGEFVPDTLHFIAQETPDSPPRGFRLQKFIEGKAIDEIEDQKLFEDSAVVSQLLGLTNAGIETLKAAKENETHQPDFRRAPDGTSPKEIAKCWLSDPRYTKNIIIADKPDENGRRVFFVDTGINAQERTSKFQEKWGRSVVNPLEQANFKRFKKKLEEAEKENYEKAAAEEPKFLTQWKNPEQRKINDTEVFVYDIKPEEPGPESPVVFAPGFGGRTVDFKKDIDALVESGRRVVSVDAPHGVEHEFSEEKKRGLPDAELRKVAGIVETLKEKGIEKADGVGNSEGGMVLVLAAALYPELFRSLVLENPPGLIGKDSTARLATRFGKDIIKSEVNARLRKIKKEAKEEAAPKDKATDTNFGNLKKAFMEVRAIAKTQLPELLREIKKNGTKISVIHGADDDAFPMERVQKMVNSEIIDGFYSVKGSHAEVRTKEAKKAYTELARYALEKMSEKK